MIILSKYWGYTYIDNRHDNSISTYRANVCHSKAYGVSMPRDNNVRIEKWLKEICVN